MTIPSVFSVPPRSAISQPLGRSRLCNSGKAVDKVLGVHLMNFGIPEAMWHLRVNNFVAIVTMDSHGNSLHADVETQSGEALKTLQPVS